MTDTPTPTTAVSRPAEPKPMVTTGGPIAGLVPTNIDEAFRLATALAQSGDMVPEAFRGNPSAIMAAMIKGMEVGLAPMQALSTIAVIGGSPKIWGDAIPALLQRAGHHIDTEIEGDGDGMVAVSTLTRSNGKQTVRRFSVADAKHATLWGKPGPWQKYPKRMLMARARMFAARDGAADALMGFEIAEVGDYGPDRARDVTPQAPRRGGVVYRDAEPPQADEVIEHHQPTADMHPDVLRQTDDAEALAALAAIQRRDQEE